METLLEKAFPNSVLLGIALTYPRLVYANASLKFEDAKYRLKELLREKPYSEVKEWQDLLEITEILLNYTRESIPKIPIGSIASDRDIRTAILVRLFAEKMCELAVSIEEDIRYREASARADEIIEKTWRGISLSSELRTKIRSAALRYAFLEHHALSMIRRAKTDKYAEEDIAWDYVNMIQEFWTKLRNSFLQILQEWCDSGGSTSDRMHIEAQIRNMFDQPPAFPPAVTPPDSGNAFQRAKGATQPPAPAAYPDTEKPDGLGRPNGTFAANTPAAGLTATPEETGAPPNGTSLKTQNNGLSQSEIAETAQAASGSAVKIISAFLENNPVKNQRLGKDMLNFAEEIDNLKIKPGQKIMDLGPGSIYVAGLTLALYGCDVYVVDPKKYKIESCYIPEAAELLRSLYKGDDKKISEIMGRIHPVPMHLRDIPADIKYDVVVAMNILGIMISGKLSDDLKRLCETLADKAILIVGEAGDHRRELETILKNAGFNTRVEPRHGVYHYLKGYARHYYVFVEKTSNLQSLSAAPAAAQDGTTDHIISPKADLRTIFTNNSRPLCIEVGFGKGAELVKMALAHPDVNYVGIEPVGALGLNTSLKNKKTHIPNLRLVDEMDMDFFNTQQAQNIVDEIYYIAWDPNAWTALYTETNIRNMLNLIKPEGRIYISTDSPLSVISERIKAAGFVKDTSIARAAMFPHPSDDYQHVEFYHHVFQKQAEPPSAGPAAGKPQGSPAKCINAIMDYCKDETGLGGARNATMAAKFASSSFTPGITGMRTQMFAWIEVSARRFFRMILFEAPVDFLWRWSSISLRS